MLKIHSIWRRRKDFSCRFSYKIAMVHQEPPTEIWRERIGYKNLGATIQIRLVSVMQVHTECYAQFRKDPMERYASLRLDHKYFLSCKIPGKNVHQSVHIMTGTFVKMNLVKAYMRPCQLSPFRTIKQQSARLIYKLARWTL